jgi:hypothetical protein
LGSSSIVSSISTVRKDLFFPEEYKTTISKKQNSLSYENHKSWRLIQLWKYSFHTRSCMKRFRIKPIRSDERTHHSGMLYLGFHSYWNLKSWHCYPPPFIDKDTTSWYKQNKMCDSVIHSTIGSKPLHQ